MHPQSLDSHSRIVVNLHEVHSGQFHLRSEEWAILNEPSSTDGSWKKWQSWLVSWESFHTLYICHVSACHKPYKAQKKLPTLYQHGSKKVYAIFRLISQCQSALRKFDLFVNEASQRLSKSIVELIANTITDWPVWCHVRPPSRWSGLRCTVFNDAMTSELALSQIS